MTAVKNRFNRRNPCPVCGGYDQAQRGRGIRCYGYLDGAGEYARCTREDHAGDLERNADDTYSHRLQGRCRCGGQHDAGATSTPTGGARGSSTIVATYDYRNTAGDLVFEVVRYEPKAFKQRRPDGNGGWLWNLHDVERVLYRLPELLHANGEVAIIAEGERDVDRLRELGLIATCNAGGAGKWRPEYGNHLKGRRVAIISDNDDAGRRHAAQVAQALAGVASEVKVVELPGLPGHGDVSDWLDAGHTVNELLALVDAPAPELVATASLLYQVHNYIKRYVLLPGQQYLDVMALWVLHTYVLGAADTTPRLLFKSPEKESGKTRALEVLDQLVAAPISIMNATIAGIFRTLADGQVTILFDEVDAVFGVKAVREHEDLRALLNAGYRRGASVIRVVGDGAKMRAQRFPVFAAAALAAIGDLPDTVESRSIIIPMRRRAPDETLEPFRLREASALSEGLRQGLVTWGSTAEPMLAESRPQMPEGVTDRAADCWELLIAIADSAGGEWPARARDAASFVVAGRVADDLSIGVRLLTDIKTVMGKDDKMPSAVMVAKLNAIEESGWGAWHDGKGMTARDLAHRLKRYFIRPKVIRVGEATPSGYMRDDFMDAFARYLRVPSGGVNKVNSVNAISTRVEHVEDVEDTDGAGFGAFDDQLELQAVTTAAGVPVRKTCPDGHVCYQSPNGSPFCCGHPADDLAPDQLDHLYQEALE